MPGFVRAYWPFLPLCFGVFIAADDQTVVVTILPDLLLDLKVGVTELDRASWTITGYLIGFTAAMPLMGRVSDRFGHRPAYIGAMSIFMVGSALVAVSPEIPAWLHAQLPGLFGSDEPDLRWTVGARVFQAVGGGAVMPIAIASVGDLLPRYRYAIAFGLVGASAEAGGVIGPLWGGLATHYLSWEWAFWMNIPLGLIVIAFVMRSPRGVPRPVKIDLVGAALFAATLALLTTALSRSGERDAVFLALLGSAAATAAATIWWLSWTRAPLVPRRLVRAAQFAAANGTHLLIGAALIIAMVTVPLMADTVLGASPLEGGLRLLRLTAAIPVGALIGGAITQRRGPREVAIVGLLLVAAGFALMSRWGLEVADPWMTVHLALAGLGFGLLIAPVTASAMRSAREDERGAAASLVTVSRMIGMTVGLAAITAWGTTRFETLVADAPAFSIDPEVQRQIAETAATAGLTVFRGFFIAGAVIALTAIPPTIMMSRWRPEKL